MGEAHEKTKKKIAGNGKEGSRFKVWWCQLIRFKTLEGSRDNLGIHKRIVGAVFVDSEKETTNNIKIQCQFASQLLLFCLPFLSACQRSLQRVHMGAQLPWTKSWTTGASPNQARKSRSQNDVIIPVFWQASPPIGKVRGISASMSGQANQ